ncbi:hypothetical protein EDF54_0284 [Rathayibacter sp. PhB93]|jgi:predicted nucleic acid-binding protein|uniref:PIN domain-containing protein n=1 Tax=unclassified Rathayibacter TaxID=2609250 RepID=UPI000F4784DE|nr:MULTISPECIES: PIN domain-containing protein [unclassified Rathayibacter]ROQ15422.1 hypothetical protein EDF54_0284 [Rathayibacter sp. PhB93]TDQ15360.1 hypothetical protein EDF17_0029 [Rathayibacter sp. PhB1]
MSASAPVLVDTDVFSHLFVRRPSAVLADGPVAVWRRLLRGRRIVISFQTRVELLQGAAVADWGDARVAALRSLLDSTPTIGVDDEVIEAHVALFAECRRRGHALHDKRHTGDRWIASCARAKGLSLLAADGLYRGAPGLDLLGDGVGRGSRE